MTKLIKLTQGKHAIIDDEDYEWLSGREWCAQKGKYTWYAVSIEAEGKNRMHRLILGADIGQQVDHQNHDGLDNRRTNIRIATRSQNGGNRLPVTGKSSKFKGVSFDRDTNKWAAYIRKNLRLIKLGRYHSENDAAKAYDEAAIKYFGAFAMTNAQLFGV